MYEGCVAFSAGNLRVGGIGMEYVQSGGDGGVSEWWEEARETGRGESYEAKKFFV